MYIVNDNDANLYYERNVLVSVFYDSVSPKLKFCSDFLKVDLKSIRFFYIIVQSCRIVSHGFNNDWNMLEINNLITNICWEKITSVY